MIILKKAALYVTCSGLMYMTIESKPFPICFSISETKIVKEIPVKEKDFAFIIPGDLSTYIYTEEQEYYKDYQRSYYAITRKKGGWDCLRHYEILANGCIPYFINLEQCPQNTMHLLPKDLILQAMRLPGVYKGRIDHAQFDKQKYYEVLEKLLDYTKKNLTTRSVAQYVLDTMGYTRKGPILFLSNDPNPDYLKTCILIGLKQLIPERVIDFPRLDHIYTDYPHDTKLLYGKGLTYTKVVEDIPVDRSDIEARIKNQEFELIIYAHTHYGLLFHNLVTSYYPAEKIAYMDGEDEHRNCKFAHLHNFFLREYDAYAGS
jgi:hypothetical protein